MRKIRARWFGLFSLAMVAALLIAACGSQPTAVDTESPEPTIEPTQSFTNSVQVEDQALADGNMVVVPNVTSESAGWMVIHADGDGGPGPVIGYTAVTAGENEDVQVSLDPEGLTETLYAMLHVDAGSQGDYEFPGDDVPARDAAGDVVVKPFSIELPNVNSLETEDQALGPDNQVTVPSVSSSSAGWMVIHAAGESGPGPVIGFAPVAAGTSQQVKVEIDPARMTGTLYAMLHRDDGSQGEYEFPGDDVPARDAEGNVVVKPFNLLGNAVGVQDQPLVDGANVTIQAILSDGPGWIVIHQDNEGAPGAILGFAPVEEGFNRNVVVEIDGTSATERLYAMLHIDEGEAGEFEFPDGADVPARDSEGNVVTPSFNLIDAAVEVQDQDLAEDNTIQVPWVAAESAGWMVIHADNEGAPGPILGFAPITGGINENVEVELNGEGLTETVYAMLHVDLGASGEFEFPGGPDAPARNDEGDIIVKPFQLSGQATGEAALESVVILDNEFTPKELSIPVGTTVSWQHNGSLPHTVTADDSQFNSNDLVGGDTFSFTFDQPGEYTYHCQFHGNPGAGMSGTIIVTES